MGRREAFDPLRSFVANRDFSWGGKPIKAGEEFSDRRDMRRLRQLYDNRFLRMSEVDNGAPAFKQMSDDQLRQWLIDNGADKLAHPRSPNERLIERCRRIWLAQQHGGTNGVDAGHVHPQGSREGVQGASAAGDPPPRSSSERERLR
jgi:hypothetical protein